MRKERYMSDLFCPGQRLSIDPEARLTPESPYLDVIQAQAQRAEVYKRQMEQQRRITMTNALAWSAIRRQARLDRLAARKGDVP